MAPPLTVYIPPLTPLLPHETRYPERRSSFPEPPWAPLTLYVFLLRQTVSRVAACGSFLLHQDYSPVRAGDGLPTAGGDQPPLEVPCTVHNFLPHSNLSFFSLPGTCLRFPDAFRFPLLGVRPKTWQAKAPPDRSSASMPHTRVLS